MTPLARNEWICWTISVKKAETRKAHADRAVEDLKAGKRRPCCWIGCIHRTDKPVSPSVQGLLLALLLCLTAPLNAQTPDSIPAGWPAFAATFDSVAREDGAVGGSVLLMSNGKILDRHHYGMADRSRAQPVDDSTLFHYGSITKTLTAVAIMQLRDRGILSLDDKVTSYIPELRQIHDPWSAIDSITIRMLLSHSAGFQDPTWPYTSGEPWEPFEPTRWEQLVSMMPYQELHFRPGSRYGYSNPAFIYLARILEQVTGDRYQSYIEKNIWSPLGMSRSYFSTTPWYLSEHRSNSYEIEEDSSGQRTMHAYGREFDPGITIPNGGWNAPLDDLARWAAFLTGAPAADPAVTARYDVVLSQETLDEMWQPIVTVGDGPEAVGLSFFLTPRASGDTLVGHTGWQAGFRAFMYFHPETRAAVIGVFNTTNYSESNASAIRYEMLLGRAMDLIEAM